MARTISQRELRNESGEIMRALDRGESFLVTRNGVAVGQLTPLRRRQFTSTEEILAAFADAPALDAGQFRRDLDRFVSQVPDPGVVDERHPRGLIDTSVVIGLETTPADHLPAEVAVSAVTMAELAAGPHATNDSEERARRQDRLQRVEASFDPLPFDAGSARAYGRIYSAVVSAGRKARGARAVDLLIAATAVGVELPLYTRNPDDFRSLEGLLTVVPVR